MRVVVELDTGLRVHISGVEGKVLFEVADKDGKTLGRSSEPYAEAARGFNVVLGLASQPRR